MVDLKVIHHAPTREVAEATYASWMKIGAAGMRWPSALVRTTRKIWPLLVYPAEIWCGIYTTNTVKGYNHQLRKVTKSRGSIPTAEAVRKLLFLANRYILKKWTIPTPNKPSILNQLVIRFDDMISLLCAICLHPILAIAVVSPAKNYGATSHYDCYPCPRSWLSCCGLICLFLVQGFKV